MFVFISGYFNRIDENSDLPAYIKRKLLRLMVPYALLNIFARLIEILLFRIRYGQFIIYDPEQVLAAVLRVFTTGEAVDIAQPLWFVPALCAVELIYAFIKKPLKKLHCWSELLAVGVFAVLNVIVVCIAKNLTIPSYYLLPAKCAFLMVFFQLGILYRDHLEAALKKINPLIIMAVILVINVFRIMRMEDWYQIAFNELAKLTGFSSPYYFTPLVSSLAGILFWVSAAELLAPALSENKLIRYISDNTMWILGLHLLMFNILNCILYWINGHLVPLAGFDVNYFQATQWYRWEPVDRFRVVYVIWGLTGTVLLKVVYDRLKIRLYGRLKKKADAGSGRGTD